MMDAIWFSDNPFNGPLELPGQAPNISPSHRFITASNRRLKRKYKYGQSFVNDFASLWNQLEESFPDIRIISSDGKEHKAHKCVLIARSPVLKAMLSSGMCEAQSNTIQMDDLSPKAVNFILHFMYTCEVLPYDIQETNETASISECIYAATKYLINDLVDHFDQTLASKCNEENARSFMELANKFGLKGAQQEIMAFIMKRPSAMKRILESL